MKKMIFSLVLSFCSFASLFAMSYDEAREKARFLTDKMAYELNLNDQQYNDCYEINLDYLLGVQTAGDVYGDYLSYRNADIRHILYDWQYALFTAADYFFHPLTWYRGAWYFPVYRHYAVNHFYYSHPAVFYSYRGGHGRHYYHAGFYGARRPHWNGGFRGMDRAGIGHHGGHVPHHGGSPSTHHGGSPSFHHGGSSSSHHGGSPSYHHDGQVAHHGGSPQTSRQGHDTHSSHHSQGYNHPSSTRATYSIGGGGAPRGGSVRGGSGSRGRRL